MKKYIVYIVIMLCIGVGIFLHYAPVEFDARVCGGGYRTYITQKEIQKLLKISKIDLGHNITLVSSQEEISNTIKWSGRNISLVARMEGKDKKLYDVTYVGKRYRIERYDWTINEIKALD